MSKTLGFSLSAKPTDAQCTDMITAIQNRDYKNTQCPDKSLMTDHEEHAENILCEKTGSGTVGGGTFFTQVLYFVFVYAYGRGQ